MFTELPLLPADPILGLSAAFAADTRTDKIDLGVGIYKTEAGNTPILTCVQAAEQQHLQSQTTKAYTPPSGIAGANIAAAELVFGAGSKVLKAQRLSTIQTPGGCGALRVAAELINRATPDATVWVSTPTWGNHIPLLGNAGLNLKEYPYYDYTQHAIDFTGMMTALEQAGPEDLVLLHACCHNPSGADLTREQWQQVAELAQRRGFTPFIDMAYQGFGEGVEEDAYGVRLLADTLPELIVATSFSKNLGLYRERVGSLNVVANSAEQARANHSQLMSITRGLYSMPPAHGSALVDIIYHNNKLRAQWFAELGEMRQRINHLREQFASHLNHLQQTRDFSFIQREQGMFSFLGLTPAQVRTLRDKHGIYMTDNSRINVAGINTHNLPRLAEAVAAL